MYLFLLVAKLNFVCVFHKDSFPFPACLDTSISHCPQDYCSPGMKYSDYMHLKGQVALHLHLTSMQTYGTIKEQNFKELCSQNLRDHLVHYTFYKIIY